jgi:hypothetical protein
VLKGRARYNRPVNASEAEIRLMPAIIQFPGYNPVAGQSAYPADPGREMQRGFLCIDSSGYNGL